jgi:hypothetical protein
MRERDRQTEIEREKENNPTKNRNGGQLAGRPATFLHKIN